MNVETGGPRVVPVLLAELNSKWSLLAGHTGWLQSHHRFVEAASRHSLHPFQGDFCGGNDRI